MKTVNFLAKLVICFVLIPVLVGCEKDDELDCSTGARLVSMKNLDQRGAAYVQVEDGVPHFFCIDDANNFVSSEYRSVEFVTVGEVDSLNKINKIPATGWIMRAGVVKGYGYVGRYRYGGGPYSYIRIYVVDYIISSDGVEIGAKIQFAPLKGKVVQGEIVTEEVSYYSYPFGEWEIWFSYEEHYDVSEQYASVSLLGGNEMEFAFVGKIDDLKAIKLPKSAKWSERGVVFEEAHDGKKQVVNWGGYIARYKQGSSYLYTRIYVSNFVYDSRGHWGATVTYQCPWIPGK